MFRSIKAIIAAQIHKRMVIMLTSLSIYGTAVSQNSIPELKGNLQNAKEDTVKVNDLNRLAWEFRSNDPDTAGLLATQALTLANKLNFSKGKAEALINNGVASLFLGNYEASLKDSYEAIQVIKGDPSLAVGSMGKKLLAKAFNSTANIAMLQGNYDTAIAYHNKALEIRIIINDRQGIADSYNNLAAVFYNRGNYLDALKHYKLALEIKKNAIGKNGKPEDPYGLANAYNNLGTTYNHLGNNTESVKNYFLSLKIRDEIGDKLGKSSVYTNLGLLYEEQGNYLEALKFYNLSLKIDEETGSKLGMAMSKINIGNLYNSLKRYKEALEMHAQALKALEELGDKRGIANCYINMGNNYNDLGNFEAALKNYSEGLKMYEETDNLQGIASANNNIGRILMAQKNFKEARPFLLKGMNYSLNCASKDYIKISYKNISELDRNEALFGNVSLARKAELLESALENYKIYIEYRDSLVNEQVAQKTLEQKMQYDFDKKEGIAKAEHGKQMAVVEADKKRQGYVIIVALIIAIAVGVIAIVVFRALKVTRKQKGLIEIKNKETEEQKLVIEEKQKEIIDSILYARRIQTSLLASDMYIEKNMSRLKSKQKS